LWIFFLLLYATAFIGNNEVELERFEVLHGGDYEE
jgi:hypothetical protein